MRAENPGSGMTFSSAGASVLKRVEALKLCSYPDSKGIATIGFGHTKNVVLGMACTEQDALRWFAED